MAQSSGGNITARIRLEGGREVQSQLEAIGKSGESANQKLGRSATSASGDLGVLTADSGRVSNAIQNLGFQVNDIATSLASGGSVARVFAQQGGQIFQAFTQGGGLSNVLAAVTSRVQEMITPMRSLAAAGGVAAAVFALLGKRALESDNAIAQFGVTLRGLGKTPGGLPEILRGPSSLTPSGTGSRLVFPTGGSTTAADLEKAAQGLRDAGLSLADARAKLLAGIRAGIDPSQVAKIVRIGQDLNAVLGEGAADRFVAAVAGGVGPLRDFAAQLNVVGKNTTAAQDGLNNVPALIDAIGSRVKDADRNSLGPLGRTVRDINARFNELEDSAAQFFKEGTVNAVDTTKAFGDLLDALGKTIGRGDLSGLQRGLSGAFAGVDLTAFRERLLVDLTAIGASGGEALKTAIGKGGQLAAELGKVITDAMADLPTIVSNGFASLGSATDALAKSLADVWSGFSSNAKTAIDYVVGLLNSLGPSLSSLFSSSGSSSQVVASAPILPEVPDFSRALGSFAAGGLIRGPGTSTSDSVPIWASAGEFVVNAASTRVMLPVLQAINSIRGVGIGLGAALDGIRPAVPRFATGGLVTAAAGGGATHTHFFDFGGGRVGPFYSDDGVADAMTRHARRRAIASAGRKPGSVTT